MATKAKPADRSSLQARAAVVLNDLRDARDAYREACLHAALAPDNTAHQHAVAELEREIAQHELTLKRIEEAVAAQGVQDTTKAAAERIAAAKSAAAVCSKLAEREHTLLQSLAELFATGVAPALAELDSLRRERAASAAQVLRAVKVGHQDRGSSYRMERLAGDSAATSVVLAAISCSGLGAIGPTLEPFVAVAPPVGGFGTPEAKLQQHSERVQDLRAFLAELIAKAESRELATSVE